MSDRTTSDSKQEVAKQKIFEGYGEVAEYNARPSDLLTVSDDIRLLSSGTRTSLERPELSEQCG